MVSGKTRADRFLYFFPFQLLLLHLKRNHFLLFFWLILFAFTTEAFATKFGIPYLFLAPEYMGQVGFRSYFILGFSLGGFIMAFNIYTYILHSRRFPFLGTLARPFFKFCINNFIIPLGFIVTYIYYSSSFLATRELLDAATIAWYMFGFVAGNALFIAIAVAYFFPTNKNIFMITGTTAEQLEELVNKRRAGLLQKGIPVQTEQDVRWRVETYLSHPFKINLARDTLHYDKETLTRVFYQNHINASFFEVILIVAFLLVGAFQFNDFFVIPAASSAFLVFTVILMFISIIMSWLKGWTLTILVVLLLLFDYASGRYDLLNVANAAYGLDYSEEPAAYNQETIDALNSDLLRVQRDKKIHEAILNDWLEDERRKRGDRTFKPKFVILNTSGGGLRASLWTVRSLQYLDSIFQGEFLKRTRLISGSSGGSIGAAYYRELALSRDSLSHDIYSSEHLEAVSKDILNRVLFTFATNDIFIRFRRVDIFGYEYVLDRAVTFEDQLNKNTFSLLNKPVSSYGRAVESGEVPMMVIAPSIVNDGRRLLISSQPISYLCYDYPETKSQLNLNSENIEFNRLFANHDASNLSMLSALRMNSTFPYILPNAVLPTVPAIEVMDAGLRDNFGIKVSIQYLFAFKDWIEKNTSGVVIVQLRDTEKRVETKTGKSTIIDKLTNPIGSFYGNFFHDQDYNMDQLVKTASESFRVPMHHIPLEIRYEEGEHVALSWHLTTLEKKKIINSLDLEWNRESIENLEALMAE
jgi:hypothetical protein